MRLRGSIPEPDSLLRPEHLQASATSGHCGDSRLGCESGCVESRSVVNDGETGSDGEGSGLGQSRAARKRQFRTTW